MWLINYVLSFIHSLLEVLIIFFFKFKKMKPNLRIFIKMFARSFVRFKARGLVSNKKKDF